LKLASVDSKKIESEHRRLSPTLRNIIEHWRLASRRQPW